MTEVRVTHIGGPTTLIEVGGWRLLTDPTFDPPGRRYSFGWGTSPRKTCEAGAGLLVEDSVGYCFLAKLPVSISVSMPSLTRRFSLARVPSTFFGNSAWSRASQTSRARSGPLSSLNTARMRG